jgi:HEAT repeat protein
MRNQAVSIGQGDRRMRQSFIRWRRCLSRSFGLLFAIALALTLCTQISAQEEPKPKPQEWQIRGIEAALEDDRAGVLKQAFEQLASYEPQTVQSLTRPDMVVKITAILKDPQQDSSVRSRAAEALGNFGEAAKDHIPAILDFIKDPQQDSNVRGSAAEALGNFGEAVEDHIPAIVALLKDPRQDSIVRGSAAYALSNLGEAAKDHIPTIVALLKDPQQDSYPRGSAAAALGNLGEAAKDHIPAILDFIKDPQQDSYPRRRAAYALGDFGEAAKDHIPTIVDFIKDPQQDSNVRGSAAEALGNFGEAVEDHIPAIAAILKDPQQDSNVRGSAAFALSNLGEAAKDHIPAIAAILKHPQQNSYLRGSAAAALGNFGEAAKDHIPAIVALLRDPQQDSDVRISAAAALGNFGEAAKDHIPAIVALLKDPQQHSIVRRNAAAALGNFGEAAKDHIPAIVDFIKDPQQDIYLRGSAAAALGNFGEAAKDHIPAIVALLKDPQQHSLVRGSAAAALGNFGEAAKDHIPAILDFIKDPQQDSYFRGSAAAALGKLAELNLEQMTAVFSFAYEEKADVDDVRFDAYLLSGGDEEIKRLLRWIARPKQLPTQLSHTEGVKTLEAFRNAWDASKDFPELRDDLADKIARVSKLVSWQTTDLPLLKQHHSNLKAAGHVAADSVQTTITALEGWQWFSTFRTVIVTHAAIWLALIFVYPKFSQVQAIFFWNPWMRKFFGFGYVGVALTWVPFLRRKLFEPFRTPLLADARLRDFNPDLYFADSQIQLRGSDTPQSIRSTDLTGQIILEGDSGLGKTMFLRHLLTQTRRIAVYLPATKCDEGVLEAIQRKLHSDEIKDAKFLQSLIYSGAIDIYIDGLNEVSPDTRAKITQFVESYFRGNILMTTQPLEWIAPATAKTYVLQPLQLKQIEAYLLSRQPTKTAQRQGEAYKQACCAFLTSVLGDRSVFAPEEQTAVHAILSNPMELTLAAQILADGKQPDLLNLRQQQYGLMAADYQRMWKHSFPLDDFSEVVYQLRLTDQRALPDDKFYNELQCMEDEKFRMVITRQWEPNPGEIQKEWYFRHDKITEFFIVQTFLGDSDEAKNRLQTHLGDPRFRGVYFLLATLLPLDAAQDLREDLIDYAADTKDHTVSDTFVQLVRSRKAIAHAGVGAKH